MDLTLSTHEADGTTVVAVGGEIDVYTAPRLRDKFTELVAAGSYDIIVDMQNAYLSKGGYIDLVGFDVSGAAPVIEETAPAATSAPSFSPHVFSGQLLWSSPACAPSGAATDEAGMTAFPEAASMVVRYSAKLSDANTMSATSCWIGATANSGAGAAGGGLEMNASASAFTAASTAPVRVNGSGVRYRGGDAGGGVS